MLLTVAELPEYLRAATRLLADADRSVKGNRIFSMRGNSNVPTRLRTVVVM